MAEFSSPQGSRRIDVDTEIDWHETEKILKAAFPIDVHADRSAAEIQFGRVYRPTHTNTSWDAARFEVYAHRWVHVAGTTRPRPMRRPAPAPVHVRAAARCMH